MPEPKLLAGSPPSLSRSAVRLVLFGMPDAGKSSLVGALAQAAQTQEHLLHGHLTDVGHGLAEMQRRLYDEQPRNTVEEVLPFPMVFEPFAKQLGGKQEAVLIDCDGRTANELLSRRRELEPRRGSLARAILEADAVVFVVDAAAGAAQIDADLSAAARFLRLLEERRGMRADVGGLPVFLVLTKCDLLAQAGDDLAAWIEKIEERKRQVGRRFQGFLDQAARTDAPGFGTIHLHVWATSVKRPELSDGAARPREPYGVAELFRQCFALATEHRRRRGRSNWRLLLTLCTTIGAIAVLASMPYLFVTNRPSETVNDLEQKVSQLRAREQELPQAARYRQIQERIDRLYEVRTDKGYSELPAEMREYVEARLRDLEEYDALAAKVDALADARELRNAEQLQKARQDYDRIEKSLDAHPNWLSTDMFRRLNERRDEIQALDRAVQDVTTRYHKAIQEGRQVLKNAAAENLPNRARLALKAGKELPNPKDDANRAIPGCDRLTYAVVFEFDSVRDLPRQWDELKKQLEPFASLK